MKSDKIKLKDGPFKDQLKKDMEEYEKLPEWLKRKNEI